MGKVYIYKQFERIWHWSQAALIIFLALTGFEVHGSFTIFGFEKAVFFHRFASWLLMILIVFAVFWHIVTGEWKQYVPTTKLLKEQILYYSFGMFKGDPHPTEKTSLSKLNPLQRLVYLGFKLFLIPVTVISGILYFFHKTFDANNIIIVEDISIESIALWHTLGAILLIVFLIVHVYMTTTGQTPSSNIKAMITGYEDIDDNHGPINKPNDIKE
jgi:thiosulfate reductase cytochrome b subunit